MRDQISAEFWLYLEKLIQRSSIVIDRPKGSTHPNFSDLIYPLDYGYLQDTVSSDGAGLDVWVGELGEKKLTAVICTVDLRKNDLEIKILLGCSEGDVNKIMDFHNSGSMRGILIHKSAVEVHDELKKYS
jgi:inorganic pyrophosphatase